jgi:ADP-ribose pyrophosphatase YjhB (NUDIX family)
MIDTAFYQNLPKKRIAAGALILNDKGQMLLVKPTYKETWEVPGGITESNESPRACVEREIKEELGLDITISKLLCLDYVTDLPEKGDSLQMIFDGGILSEEQIKSIKLEAKELSEYRFFNPDNIDVVFKDKLRFRMQKAWEAKLEDTALFVENPYV